MFFSRTKSAMPTAETALPGRNEPLPTAPVHAITGNALRGPYPDGLAQIQLGMGCFWGAERRFWQLGEGIHVTAAGYAGGFTPNATYEEVCTGRTGHTEVVLVVYDPDKLPLSKLLRTFWESHDPTQGMRQGNDVGTQYRSAIFCSSPEQLAEVQASAADYGRRLAAAGMGPITTEIAMAPTFYFAEAYHQQYLHKVPGGYCGLRGTGVACAL